VIEISARENNSRYGGVSYSFGWIRMDFGVAVQLLAKIGRGINQKPGIVVRRDGQLRLGSGLNVGVIVTQSRAVGAGAVPLWKAATSGGPQNLDSHANRLTVLRERRS
jgi:hypothetical protein